MDDKLFPPSPLFPAAPGDASFVAIGDSFTEGLNDVASGGGFRGWADRLAGLLAAEYPGLRYANLAVRGRLLRQIVAGQVPAAAAMSPGLVALGGGGNDLLRPGADPDTLAELFDAGVARLQGSGSRVLVFTACDTATFPLFRLLRGRIAAYNMHLRAVADARGCYLVDLWSMPFLHQASARSPDRLHLTAQSHQRVALRCAEVLGLPVTEDWRAPLADGPGPGDPGFGGPGSGNPAFGNPAFGNPAFGGLARPAAAALTRAEARTAWLAARREDARWTREYLAPWVSRRLHGISTGDGLTAKRPKLEVIAPPITM
jgi:lysophospholipase L1-like esterase